MKVLRQLYENETQEFLSTLELDKRDYEVKSISFSEAFHLKDIKAPSFYVCRYIRACNNKLSK